MSLLNLKEILASDSVTEKLDKINYNFDILINTSGPIGNTGATGSDGNIGTIGITGQPGNSGEQGPSGSIGTSGTSEWITNQYTNSNNNSTYILSPDYVAGNKTSTIVIGHPDINSESYNSVFDKSQLTIFNNSEYDSNIRLVTQGSEDFFDINFNTSNELELGFNQGASGYTLKLEASNLSFSDLANIPIINADINQISFNKDTYFINSNVAIVGGLKLDFGSPSADKIACSDDIDGNVVWKNLSELVNAIPVGMIVPVLHSVLFDAVNFVQTHPFTYTSTEEADLYVGRGQLNTAYEGWYICNGKTWNNVSGDSFDTPDLNSFVLDINTPDADDHPSNNTPSDNNAQFDSYSYDVVPGIVGSNKVTASSGGGANFNMDVSSDKSLNITTAEINTNYHNDYLISRVPHIIYLGVNDLKWNDSGMVGVKFMRISGGGNTNCEWYNSPNQVLFQTRWIHNSVLRELGISVNSEGYVVETNTNELSHYRYRELLMALRQLSSGYGFTPIADDNVYPIIPIITAPSNVNQYKVYADKNAQTYNNSALYIYDVVSSVNTSIAYNFVDGIATGTTLTNC
jgi:hypothetical protein